MRYQVGVVMVGFDTVAFTYDNVLYLAPLTGIERPVARGEVPIGFTTGGLYTYRYKRALLLRSDAGAIRKTIAVWPFDADYQVADGSLYFITQNKLMRARGTGTRQLMPLWRLGLSGAPWIQSLGPLLELEYSNRLVVLRTDGSEFASTPVPGAGRQRDTISSSLVVAPNASAVAFTAAAGGAGSETMFGPETTYVLRADAQSATPVHTEQVEFKVCERGASVQWHGNWLLYSNSEGNLVAIDTTRARRAVDLSNLAKSLGGARHDFTAYWS